MPEESQNHTEKSISEQLQELLPQLSTNQLRFIVARQECNTDGEAAEMIGMKPDTIYRWPDTVKRAVLLMAGDGVITAREILRRNVAKAASVKAAGLDSLDEKIKQDAATEILDRNLGKPTQRQEHTGEGGGPIKAVWDWQREKSE